MWKKQLVEAARAARAGAYAPYSDFCVGAALLAADGSVYTGVNIENAVYPLGCCAERVALYTAVCAGAREFTAIAIAGGARGAAEETACPPCGACRQTLAEFCGGALSVLLAREGGWDAYPLAELLPHSFSAQTLRQSSHSETGGI